MQVQNLDLFPEELEGKNTSKSIPTSIYKPMTPKDKELIERFINGEKQLFKQIEAIKLDDSVHGIYIRTLLFSDDMVAVMNTKKAVIAVMKKPEKKLKPSFTPRKSKV
jgi:hypothetical protein